MLGVDDMYGDGKDVREGRAPGKPGQDQSNGMHTGVHLGPKGRGGLLEERDG